ncbi:MAG: WXG100 family type VII secretion target [Erysipelotrichaceae bacterium]|nr:WXG100 family type VII secretion target [Erysipelotrichaceae bacterium]
MAKVIEVTPAQLESAAGKIDGHAGDYQSLYQEFYKVTDDMAANWDGKDNLAFIERISGFRDDFQKMYQLMLDYADYLRKAAKNYRDTQDSITSQAKNLQN